MKINAKMLSIPPYISTSWENISSLQADPLTGILHIFLTNKQTVSIPGLPGPLLEGIFRAHAEFLEHPPTSPLFPLSRPLLQGPLLS